MRHWLTLTATTIIMHSLTSAAGAQSGTPCARPAARAVGATLTLNERPKPPPRVATIHADATGLLFVAVTTTNDKWAAVAARMSRGVMDIDAEIEALFAAATDIYIDVIDTRAGVVLASEKVAGPKWVAEGMTGFFPGGFTGYRSGTAPDGSPVIRMVELRLVAK